MQRDRLEFLVGDLGGDWSTDEERGDHRGSDTIAPTTNARCTPAISSIDAASSGPAAPAFAVPMARRAMNTAVPAAPATCWMVASVALPCEYRCGGSAPVAAVNTGVKRKPRPRLSTRWVTMTIHIGVAVPKNVIDQTPRS